MKKVLIVILGLLASAIYFLIGGILTALLPNPWFIRMIESGTLDYIYLYSSAILIGLYVSVHLYKKNQNNSCKRISTAGGIGAFFAFSCPICNKILVILFGSTILMQYFEPARPFLGTISVALILFAIWWRLKH